MRIRRILLYLSLILADFLALTIILILNPALAEQLESSSFLLLFVSELIFIFPALPLYMLITKQSLKDILPLKPLGWKNVSYILVMTVLLEPVTWLLSAITSLLYPNAAMEISAMFSRENLLMALIAIALIPAFVEEICFRGALINASKGMSIMSAAIINGVLFGLIHMNPQQIPYAIFLGIIFSLYVIYTKSVFSSILAHFFINATNVFLALGFQDGTETVSSAEDVRASVIPFAVAAVIFFICFLRVYKQFRLYNLFRNPINNE